MSSFFNKKKIAVVGGGISGLSALIMLKEEGITAICFEKTDQPGGTWCYRENSTIGVPSIMPTTIINHSKEIGAISNFPPDKKYGNFMKHKEMNNYMHSYWAKNDILKYVQYNTEVIEIKMSVDYDLTGNWVVTTKCLLTDSISSGVYNTVIVCTGYLNFPKQPKYKGQEKFKGKIIHTHSLKSAFPYENKNVVIVGMGCSGLDAAVEISNVADQVYLSTQTGAHVTPRVGARGYPFDIQICRRIYTILLDLFPTDFASRLLESTILDMKFNSKLYRIEPKYRVLSKVPIINDHIGSKLLSNSVIQKPKILELKENGVLFEGESEITEADVIVMATGYEWKLPFLTENILKCEKGKMYKGIWPPHLKHSTLAFIGYLRPWGPGIPLIEMQSRFVAYIISGHGTLPTEKEMLKDIEKRRKLNDKRYVPSPNEPIHVDYVQYLDEISELFGAKPNLFKLLFNDPKLCFAIIFGPSVPYQYRLQGSHKWSGSREAIMTCEERVCYPLKQSKVNKLESYFIIFLKKTLTWLLPNA